MSPKPYAVVRAITIAAPPSAVRTQLEMVRAWTSWSPWPSLAPDTVVRHSGPEVGVGARMEWDVDRKLGRGHLELVQSDETMMVFDMDSEHPRSSGNVMVFLLTAVPGGTRVTWTMHGEVERLRKWLALVWPKSKSVGPGFSRGLAKLKVLVEGAERV